MNTAIGGYQLNGKRHLQPPHRRPLVGFTGHDIYLVGKIMLPFTLVSHVGAKQITRVLKFSVVDRSAEYSILLGRPTLFQLQAILSTLYGILKFSTSDGSEMVVAANPNYGSNAQRENKQEHKSCRSEILPEGGKSTTEVCNSTNTGPRVEEKAKRYI